MAVVQFQFDVPVQVKILNFRDVFRDFILMTEVE